MKKLLIPMLIAVIIIQLSVPIYMIIDRYDTLRNGEEFKFKVYPVDPYDAFRGRYVDIAPQQGAANMGKYGLIDIDADGYAYIKYPVDIKPQTEAYVISSGKEYWFTLPIERYYMDEKLAPKAEALTRQQNTDSVTYVTARVKNGKLVVSGLYIDGVAIEDIIR